MISSIWSLLGNLGVGMAVEVIGVGVTLDVRLLPYVGDRLPMFGIGVDVKVRFGYVGVRVL